MWKRLSLQGNYKWYDVLQELVAEYNIIIRRSIGIKPKDVTLNHEENLVKLLNATNYKVEKPQFNVGNHVYVSRCKTDKRKIITGWAQIKAKNLYFKMRGCQNFKTDVQVLRLMRMCRTIFDCQFGLISSILSRKVYFGTRGGEHSSGPSSEISLEHSSQ